MTPPHVVEAINTIAKYLSDEGYETAVITPGGGASFQLESILDRQNQLYRVIDTLGVAIDSADKSAAVGRSILQKVKDVDSVFRAFAECKEKK